jgi:hypothetical protein
MNDVSVGAKSLLATALQLTAALGGLRLTFTMYRTGQLHDVHNDVTYTTISEHVFMYNFTISFFTRFVSVANQTFFTPTVLKSSSTLSPTYCASSALQ